MLPARRELGRDLRSELLAELDAPLVERVDAPDRGLREDAVLVERERARPAWPASSSRARITDVGRFPGMTRCGIVSSGTPASSSSSAVRPNASASRLREQVRGEEVVLARASASRRPREADEVDRDERRPLVQELEYRVLRVRPRSRPRAPRRCPSRPARRVSFTRFPSDSIESCCT